MLAAMTIEIRRVRVDEWRLVRYIRLRALAEAPESFGSTYADQSILPEEYWRELVERRATSAEEATFIAVVDGVWSGMAATSPDDDLADAAMVQSMWVDPVSRRRGIADALVNTIMDWNRARGIDALTLWVTGSNRPAIRLYEKLGFNATGRTQPHPSNPALHEIEMIRPGVPIR